MAYATFQYYTESYKGTALKEEDFPAYANRASALIDHVTFDRLKGLADDQILDAARDATCAVAETLYTSATTAEGGSIASISNDGYSVNYRDTGGSKELRREVVALIRTYLANTGLMYRGVASCKDRR